jgi:hypothetical protein
MHGSQKESGGMFAECFQRTCDCHYTLLERLPPNLQDVAAARRPVIQAEHAVVREDTPPGVVTWPPPISPASKRVWRAAASAVWSPVRPATRRRRGASRASARAVAGRRGVSRRASMDVPAPGGPIQDNSSSNAFASCRLAVSKPSVNQP